MNISLVTIKKNNKNLPSFLILIYANKLFHKIPKNIIKILGKKLK